jgi:hypothetical protein
VAIALLMTGELADAICPACLGSGSRADELKLRPATPEHDVLEAQRCQTCGGRGSLGPDLRARA